MRSLHSLIVSSVNAFSKVVVTHSWTIKSGTITDIYIANNILNGYSRCQEFGLAHKLFDGMPQRDIVSWNTMIAGNVNCGNLKIAWEVLRNMRRCGFELGGYAFGSILKGVAFARRWDTGQQVHCLLVKMGYAGNVYCGSALLDMYAKCDRVEDASLVFEEMPERNSVSWNALISGYVQVGERGTAFVLFDCMEEEGLKLDDGTISPLLTLLGGGEFYKSTMQIHGKIIKHGLESNTKVCNATITSYSECGSVGDAKKVFDSSFGTRDVVTWNSMIGAYLVHNKEECAFNLFIDMQRFGFEPDIYSYTSIISACFEEAHKNHGKALHGLIIKRGLQQSVPVSNALIAMYLKNNGSMIEALNVFGSMALKDRVSWNSILTGLSQSGLSEDALKFFGHMRYATLETDHYTFSAVLRSCSDLATLQLGQQIHVLALQSGLESNEFVNSSLIFMYAKCGIIEDARKSFEINPKDSSITWNSIIFAYAQHGQAYVALDLFAEMKEKEVKLDHITFVAVLTACSHIGLVEEGCKLLKSMEADYGIPPRMEHYACAVDLYGRAGRLDEAKYLVESMPFEPDAMLWKTLLGACRACGNIELASQVASHLLEVEPTEHCTYVLLSDMYGYLRRWDERASVKRLMRERGVKKVPGWSWIEIKNEVHAFKAEDRLHPYSDEIYFVLGVLMDEIRTLDIFDDLERLIYAFDHMDVFFHPKCTNFYYTLHEQNINH
ncbi:Tetratricopeptide-like helical domain containing protein [Parasponia andersonii]|uniref:Tetratricopeptide-like helical domain containing protein n=1 Tax=Parasponia andersonii TaxID=3476 RepID=A0A2P5DIU9_PARAD|nr:Tetratricopeptide-like helical domain containing protein [Parasponia andersonii]